MGYQLRRWLADRLPDTLSSGERLVALEIADQANDHTRQAYGKGLLATVARRTGFANEKQVGKVLGKLAARGLELRVQILKDGKPLFDGKGRPVFAYEGRETSYRIPTAEECPELVPFPGDHSGLPHGGPVDASGPPPGPEWSPAGDSVVPRPGPSGPPSGGPFSSDLLRESPQERTSSLSPRAREATDPPPVVEREKRSHSKVITPHTLVKDARVIGDHEVSDFVRWAEREHLVRGNGWWRTLIKNGDLPELVVQWYAALSDDGQPPRPKDYNGSGSHIDRSRPYSNNPDDVFGPPRQPRQRPTSGPMATFDHYDEDDIWK